MSTRLGRCVRSTKAANYRHKEASLVGALPAELAFHNRDDIRLTEIRLTEPVDGL